MLSDRTLAARLLAARPHLVARDQFPDLRPAVPGGGAARPRPGEPPAPSAAAHVTSSAAHLLEVISADAVADDVAVAIFSPTPDATLEALQAQYLEACFRGAHLLAAAHLPVTAWAEPLVLTAASVLPSGDRLRSVLVGSPVGTTPWGPGPEGLLPGVPRALLLTGKALARKGCVNAVKRAVSSYGAAVATAIPTPLTGLIESVSPADACHGETLTIRGRGFGPADGGRAVVFTSSSGTVAVSARDALGWTDTEIRVAVPAGAVRGPIGLVRLPSGGASLASAASTAVGEMTTCFGPGAVASLGVKLSEHPPPAPAPTAEPGGRNLFTGGPPTVAFFQVEPQGVLHPGKRVTLRWSTDGATEVAIGTRVVGGARHELPTVAGPLGARGQVTVTVPGTRPWEAEYVLVAQNRCGTVEVSARMTMVLRRGLALGGGGTRGDFQVGALEYLYDVKGYRPDALAGTSVGALIAAALAMGDAPATATAPARSAAQRVRAQWDVLTDDDDMWGEEPWVMSLKQTSRRLLRSLSVEGLLALPYAVVAGVVQAVDVKKGLDAAGGSIFNLMPTMTRLVSTYRQAEVDASGIALRLVCVSLETSQVVTVDERGGVHTSGPTPVVPPGTPSTPRASVIEAALAAASMPGIFPARRIGDHMCVDGGVREVVPVPTAVRELGCTEVVAIRCSAEPAVVPTGTYRHFSSVMARAVLGTTFDEVADDDVAPYRGWGDEVRVTEIRPSIDLHDPMVVEPGLIRIMADYGWMRAADVLDTEPGVRATASQLCDRVIALRARNWDLAHRAAGVRGRDPHQGFTDLVLRGLGPRPEIRPVPDAAALEMIRANCLAIRALLVQRLALGAPTQPSAVRSRWFLEFETIGSTGVLLDSPWKPYSGNRTVPAATAPDPL